MKISNISAKTSMRTVISLLVICIIVVAVALVCYFNTTQVEYSVSNFIDWYINTFHNLQEDALDEKWLIWFVFMVLPLLLFPWKKR